MQPLSRILVIGGSGMLGRPVVRRLVQDGFTVRAMVRDIVRARTLLRIPCELVEGDLRHLDSIIAAMQGMDAVYTNLANPYSPREPYDPDRDGTPVVIEAAKRCGVKRLIRISAMGAPEAARDWWLIERKTNTDELAMRSGLACTVLRPTWLMESLPLLMMGRLMLRVRTPEKPLWWLAGDDYARGVAAALLNERTIGRAFDMQGHEPLTFDQAIDRFTAAWPTRLRTIPMPRIILKFMRALSVYAAYLDDLLTMTFRYTAKFRANEAWEELGKPSMTIEDYVEYVARTSDVPRK